MAEEFDEGAESDLRRRAAWLLGMLVLVAVLVVTIMVVVLGGSGDDNNNNNTVADPGSAAVTPSATSSSRPSTPSSRAASHSPARGSSTSPAGSSSSSGSSSASPGATTCPGSAKCVLDGDVGNAAAAINSYRTQHGKSAVPIKAADDAQKCALANGNGCSGGWAETQLAKPDGDQAVQKILQFGKLLDPGVKSIDIGWAYDPGAKQYYFALIRMD